MARSKSGQKTTAESKSFCKLEDDLQKLTERCELALAVIAKGDVVKGCGLPQILSAKGTLQSNSKKIAVLLTQLLKLERKGSKPGAGLTEQEKGRLKKIRSDAPKLNKHITGALTVVEKLEAQIGEDLKAVNKLVNEVNNFNNILSSEKNKFMKSGAKIVTILSKKPKDKKAQIDKQIKIIESSKGKIAKARDDVLKMSNFKMQGVKDGQASLRKLVNEVSKKGTSWEESAGIAIVLAKRHTARADLIETVGVPSDFDLALKKHAEELAKLQKLLGNPVSGAFGAIWTLGLGLEVAYKRFKS